MTQPTILITEDDPFTRRMLVAHFEKEGYRTEEAASGQEMRERLARRSPDVLLLDRNLPDEDGLVLLRQLRAHSSVPVVILSTRAGDTDRIAGLELGADDYVSKEWSPRELTARVTAVMRRGAARAPTARAVGDRILVFGGFRLDTQGHALRTVDGDDIPLTRAEYKLLCALVQAKGRTLTRDQLLDALGHSADAPYDRTVDVLISRLRKKLQRNSVGEKIIRTVPGVGYQLPDR